MTQTAAKNRETWLVLRAQSGDLEALDEVLKSVQEPLFRYILNMVRDPHLAEDVLQEVFIRIYRKLEWLSDPALFRSWAYRIASRETFRLLRRDRQWTDLERDERVLNLIPASSERGEFPPEVIEQIPNLVAGLSPASRAVIILFYLQEMSLEEVATVLEIPVGTVKSRLAYGLERLREKLKR